jgi:formylglycine-generating enzyme required for sulfatase activity
MGEKLPRRETVMLVMPVGLALVLGSKTLAVAPADAATESAMVTIPAGLFSMGSGRGDPDERPVRRVSLPAYQLDRYEVTQLAYARCVAAGACRAARRYPASVGSQMPVVGVSWHDAQAYCAWAGKRLPSEAEWERAAMGAAEGRFCWGDQADCTKANFGNFDGDGPCAAVNPGHPLAVGSRPAGASAIGAHDMAGNVWEWVADWYGPYDPEALDDPRGPKRGTERVLRGGGCCSYFSLPTVTNRHRLAPEYADYDIGFRCARALTSPRSDTGRTRRAR